MIKITFLNVGQGDSIILEWNDGKKRKIGIIDSNIIGLNNHPTLEYLKKLNPEIIQFIILSHPHTDHFSGLGKILEYCEQKNLHIVNFLYPWSLSIKFIQSAVTDNVSKSELHKLFIKVMELGEKKLIENITFIIYDKSDIRLNDEYFIKFISPSEKKYLDYSGMQNLLKNEDEDPQNNPNANILSTVLKLYSKDKGWYVLFTSDALKKTFEKIWTRNSNLIHGTLFLGQCPHHGSKHNLEKMFWKTRTKIKNSPIVFSVGSNKFKHPSEDCIDFFNKENFKVYSTNQVGALLKRNNDAGLEKQIILDLISSTIESPPSSINDTFNGDQSFEINGDEIYYDRIKIN